MNNADHILSVALDSFAARGFSAVGVQEIVDTVGVTKPTLYHYFDGKRGVLEELIKRKTSGFLQTFLDACSYRHDLNYSLQKIMKTVLSFAEDNPVFFKYFTSLQYAPMDSIERACVQPIFDLVETHLRDLFVSSVREYGNMKGKEDIQVASFWSFIVGIALLVIDGKLLNNEETVYRCLHQFEHGIYT